MTIDEEIAQLYKEETSRVSERVIPKFYETQDEYNGAKTEI